MDVLMFLYNIVLLVIYGAVCTLSLAVYEKHRYKLHLAIGLLFLIYICDNTIIYMTEFIDWFSLKYDAQFMTVPAFKTISILSQSACVLYIFSGMLKRKPQVVQYVGLLTQAFILMFVPMMADSAYKVWLYYLPGQIYMFGLSLYGLQSIQSDPADPESGYQMTIKRTLQFTVFFAVLILIEDTIVIFNFDTYSQLLVRINNRNISEDIMTMVFSYYAIRTFLSILITSAPIPAKEPFEPVPVPVPILSAAVDAEAEIIESFSIHYDLTAREQEIFSYLIKDKSNQEICEELCISIGTVKAHIHNIFGKMDVVKRSQVFRAYKEFSIEWHEKI